MNSPITGKPMQRTTRPAGITIRKVVVNIEEECWTCQESGEEFTDEAMTDHNLAQAWAAYWRTFPLSELLAKRETAVRDIQGIDRALIAAQFAEKMEAVTLRIDRHVLARFEGSEYPACFPGSQWWWHSEDGSGMCLVTSDEFDAIKRLTDQGLLKKETR